MALLLRVVNACLIYNYLTKMAIFSRTIKRIKEFNKLAQIDVIARRYLALNTFDGILTIFGIIVASFFAQIDTAKIIIIACLGAAIAIAISGFSGSYMTERAERKGQIKKLEKQIGMSLKKTDITRAHRFAIFFLSSIEGFSPFIMAVLIILPFFFITNITIAFYASFLISAMLLFLIGIFLGTVSKERLIKSGFKMLIIGAVCFAVIFFMERLTG